MNYDIDQEYDYDTQAIRGSYRYANGLKKAELTDDDYTGFSVHFALQIGSF